MPVAEEELKMDDAKKKKKVKDPKPKTTVKKSKLPDESLEPEKADELKNSEVDIIDPAGSDEESSSQADTPATESNAPNESEESADVNEIEEQQEDDSAVNKEENKTSVQKKTSARRARIKKSDTRETRTEKETSTEPENIDYAALSKEDLVAVLKDIIDKGSVTEILYDVDVIKVQFYKKHKADIEKKRKKFYEEGGAPEDFKVEEDPLERILKEYLSRFKEYKAEYNKLLDEDKHKNLEEKYRIIEEIKDLVNRKESINKTFQEFRELQRRWREVGPVPQQNLKDLWETYHHHVETFYDYIKINQELRDLDLKKNLEAKLGLCEKAEELLLEPNVITAFKLLQTLHEQWREIGPVPVEMRTEIWKRFKETTSKINKKHQEYFLNLKLEQKRNLEAKTLLCEKVEEIVSFEIDTYQKWENYSHEIIKLQKVWRTIGFAPKKDNNKIYKRFRDACDSFFNKKREFYNQTKQLLDDNLQLKTDLCIQAEALSESTEWKKTTEELIALQKRWKEIGPVPHKNSDKIWKRFRSACDRFFELKMKHFASMDNSYESNLKKKDELIEKIKSFSPSSDVEENLKMLKEFQREWANIGFVPYEAKDEIQNKYRQAINQKFDDLKIDEDKKDLLKFRTKLDNLHAKSNFDYRMNQEREKFVAKLKQLENDIVLWENNIGFFAKSKNADNMIKEVQNKISTAKRKIEVLTEKIKMIDELDND
ncbi:MAG TPA: DUF349 domain-containing protein [Bacteroidales bacterium]|nr:DUF349 domain-containing protein [Bacteroidales bacterium]